MRALPYSMMAPSAAVCQCNSRPPPAVSRMSTPARLFETGSSRCVTSRDHPPSCSRLCANENGYLKVCTPPASVGSGLTESGFCASSTEFFGPGSLRLVSEITLGPAASCAANFPAVSMLAAANVAEPAPRKPRRVKLFRSFLPLIPPPPTQIPPALTFKAHTQSRILRQKQKPENTHATQPQFNPQERTAVTFADNHHQKNQGGCPILRSSAGWEVFWKFDHQIRAAPQLHFCISPHSCRRHPPRNNPHAILVFTNRDTSRSRAAPNDHGQPHSRFRALRNRLHIATPPHPLTRSPVGLSAPLRRHGGRRLALFFPSPHRPFR